jgi:single-stranded DNA-binding protein
MQASVNQCILLGAIDKRGVEMRFATNGSPVAAFTLVLTEVWSDNQEYTTYIPVEIIGKKAETASELEAGQVVLLEGRLTRRKKKEDHWETLVSAWDVTPISTAAAVPV